VSTLNSLIDHALGLGTCDPIADIKAQNTNPRVKASVGPDVTPPPYSYEEARLVGAGR